MARNFAGSSNIWWPCHRALCASMSQLTRGTRPLNQAIVPTAGVLR